MANAPKTIEDTQKISPEIRARNFAAMTRQNWKTLSSIVAQPGQSVSFEVPKVRLTSKIRLLLKATLTVTHASLTTYKLANFAPWTLIKGLRVNINNGFAPYSISGIGLYLYNLMRMMADTLAIGTGRSRIQQGNAASASGAANNVQLLVDIPLTLNDRDPFGLILTQNQETKVDVNLELGQASDLVITESGYTYSLSNITIIPMVESFTVPPVEQAIPDLSLLKLVHEVSYTLISGVNTIALPRGTTIRKIAVLVTDNTGAPISDSGITTDFELVLNQSDIPYNVNPVILAGINQEYYGVTLPNGVWVFDFSCQGIPNYGGFRDLIDTERLTEFWLRFGTATAGTARVVVEQIARLK